MGFADVVLIVPIIGGAVYLLYRSIWKKKGYCHGCDASAPNRERRAGNASK